MIAVGAVLQPSPS
jgi:hypothetical protein